MALITFLVFSLLLRGGLGELICEELPIDLCSYSVASSGKRCLLENFMTKDGKTNYQCKTSEIVTDKMHEWIETGECMSACGVDKGTVGISSDSFLQPQFLAKLCSSSCYESCPNIVDLYFNLALAEGVYLPKLCANPRRVLYQTRSSGEAAPGPSSALGASAPAYAPAAADGVACAPTAL